MEGEEYVENTVEVMEEGMVMEEVEEEEELGVDKKVEEREGAKASLISRIERDESLIETDSD